MRSLGPVFLCAVLTACGPKTAELRRAVEGSGHRKIAVFALAASPGVLGEAAAASGALRRELEAVGFEVVTDTVAAEALATGTIFQLSERSVNHPDEYEERVRTFPDAAGREAPLVERVLLRPGRIETVSTFRAEVSLVDAATGKALARVSTWTESPGTLADAARAGSSDLARRLAQALR